MVGVAVGVATAVGINVGVAVEGTEIGVNVGIAVGFDVAVGVETGVWVAVGKAVALGIGVAKLTDSGVEVTGTACGVPSSPAVSVSQAAQRIERNIRRWTIHFHLNGLAILTPARWR